MNQVVTIGLDLAKTVFQVDGGNVSGQTVLRRQLRRSEVVKFFAKLPPCLVGMEACASAHYWAREIAALGHEVRLMPPTRVKPYVKRGRKNDQVDAAACREAVTRPSMQFVPVKTEEQQSILMLHRARKLLVEQRGRLGNALRAHVAEMGVIAAKGNAGFNFILNIIADDENRLLPAMVRQALVPLAEQWHTAGKQIDALDRQIMEWHRTNENSRRVATIPQIGAVIASTIVATIGDPNRFASGRQFAAWLGLVPSQNSSGGKDRLGGITKTGDRYVRKLLVIAAFGMLRRIRKDEALVPWFAQILKRKPPKQAAVALANKLARISWAILVKGGTYQAPSAVAA